MASAEKIDVEVAYTLSHKQVVLKLAADPEATLEQVIHASGILEQFPEINLAENKVGVFGKLGKLTDRLHSGDRVEIYRPLIADPKVVRKQRAAQGQGMKKGGVKLVSR